MEDNGTQNWSQHYSKYLLLSFREERSAYRFGMTWEWVNDDRIFTEEDILKNAGNLTVLGPINAFLTHTGKSVGPKTKKKRQKRQFKIQKSHTGLECHEDKKLQQICHFCFNYPFKISNLSSIQAALIDIHYVHSDQWAVHWISGERIKTISDRHAINQLM